MNELEDNPTGVTESENYEQILDARKLLFRQLRKLEKSDLELDLNRPSTSSSAEVTVRKKYKVNEGDDILEEGGVRRMEQIKQAQIAKSFANSFIKV